MEKNMKNKIILLFALFLFVSCKTMNYEVSLDGWAGVKESKIIELDNITLDGESFIKIPFLDDNKKPLKNYKCTVYVLYYTPESYEAMKEISKEELETSDKIGRIRAVINKDGWLYIKGIPADTPLVFHIDDSK